ncbi:probable serine/threonine-protein kinase PBL21 [Prosopis cineraria]|uniref:probable serine/threonine-protein kinase PBL21 n=1 Tax=Prosopis cineraria TaxID=364024 RepID=UPI00240E9E66|nr:probable serine/threonine-protein kinase PBL21 [Prosopis cineraria]
MEVNTIFAVAAESPSVALDEHDHHHRYHHPHVPSKTILILIITLTSFMLLLAISLIIFLLRRLKSFPRNNPTTKLAAGEEELNDTSSRFMASTASNFTSSPDVKGGCIYGGNMNMSRPALAAPKFRGVQVFTYKELEGATEGFSEANVIGNGGSGWVYKGILSDGTLAAIKLLRREGKQGERAFRIEVDLLSRLHSPYLVELIGYCADQRHRLLVFEHVANGTLQHHLHSAQDHLQPLDWWTRMRVALDCARALEFLHEHAGPTPVIHRDFNSNNVILDHNFRAKVCDFGLAKMGSDKINGQVSTRVLGTTGYLAPEYASTGKLTTKSDVYSYGVVLLELLTGRVPVDINRPPGEHVLVSWALPRLTNRDKVAEMVDPALRGQYSKKDLVQVAAIAAMCIQPEADYRPLMTDVVQSLVPLVRNTSSVSSSSSSSLRFQKHASSPNHSLLHNR